MRSRRLPLVHVVEQISSRRGLRKREYAPGRASTQAVRCDENVVAPVVDPLNHLVAGYIQSSVGRDWPVTGQGLDPTRLGVLRLEDSQVDSPTGLASLERTCRRPGGSAQRMLRRACERAPATLDPVVLLQCVDTRFNFSTPINRRRRLARGPNMPRKR